MRRGQTSSQPNPTNHPPPYLFSMSGKQKLTISSEPLVSASSGAVPYLNYDLGISADVSTPFDYLDGTIRIKPRTVVKMDWYSEREGDRHEYIVLQVSDRVYHKDVWIRFLPYSGLLVCS